jgi:predicted nucleic acid-binding protein
MKLVFADTLYWIAINRNNDPWQAAARQARRDVGKVGLVTTDEVLIEFLTAMAKGNSRVRKGAVRMVRAILVDPNVHVIPQSRESFLSGLTLFENRPDKSYSLTDCISMNVMKAEAIVDVLTCDHHFAQEGFQVLIK